VAITKRKVLAFILVVVGLAIGPVVFVVWINAGVRIIGVRKEKNP
jgi:hypothetical protein